MLLSNLRAQGKIKLCIVWGCGDVKASLAAKVSKLATNGHDLTPTATGLAPAAVEELEQQLGQPWKETCRPVWLLDLRYQQHCPG